jgi:hypothetical protein
MGKSTYLSCLLTCAVGAYVMGCGSSNSDGGAGTSSPAAGTGGPVAGGGAGAGGSAMTGMDPDPINPDCPQNDIGPMTGTYAPKGKCCYRKSNSARIDPAATKRVLDYRLNEFLLINHTKTIDPAVLGPTQIQRSENEEQSDLFHFELPQSGGKVVDGDGVMKIGVGRYNCDGTYSFYSETAAPAMGGDGTPGRWFVPSLKTKVVASKTDKDRVQPVFADQLALQNKETYSPYLGAGPAFAIDWEGESQGFDIISMPSGDENIDCVGSRKDSTSWKSGGKTKAFGQVSLNNKDVLDALGVNFAQLMAFGSVTNATDPKYNPTTVPRCMPGSAGCAWVRLPDSLCPVTADEKSKWGCHLGDDSNPDNMPVMSHCTATPPAMVDGTPGSPEGQCCDPKGAMTGGLPACNAWLQINEYVAAAAKITDAPANQVQQSCHGK